MAMEAYSLCRKTLNRRHFPIHLFFSFSTKSLSSLFSTPQTQSLLFYKSPFPSSHHLNSISSPLCFNTCNSRGCRCFSVSSVGLNVSRKQVSEIVDSIRSGQDDLQPKLDSMNVSLSEGSLDTIFRILNSEKVSALSLFDWIRQSNPDMYRNTDICSLVIDNCGRLDDFDSMLTLLNDFRLDGICLNQKAFRFLPVMISTKAATMKSLCQLVEVLNKVGGPYGLSITRSLIEMLCALGSFEMAKYVIEKTEKRLSYYSILIRARCRRGDFEEARNILDDMIRFGCRPKSQTFNYILSCLCKNNKAVEACQLLEQMQESGCPPDASTFEAFIHYMCRIGRLDMAFVWLDKMVSKGIEPRITTHTAIIKGYFELQQYDEAHKYVVACSNRYKDVSNMIYSLLVNLHSKRGEPVIAQSILSKMIEEGLKPNFRVHITVIKQLRKLGREELARNLESSFSSLISQPSCDNG